MIILCIFEEGCNGSGLVVIIFKMVVSVIYKVVVVIV